MDIAIAWLTFLAMLAEDMVKVMLYKPSATIWRALLGACRIHSKVEMG
jgi:hypothetical protein